MHDFKVGDLASTTICHLGLIGEPKTDLYGKIVGFCYDMVQLEVPYYGTFNVELNKTNLEITNNE